MLLLSSLLIRWYCRQRSRLALVSGKLSKTMRADIDPLWVGKGSTITSWKREERPLYSFNMCPSSQRCHRRDSHPPISPVTRRLYPNSLLPALRDPQVHPEAFAHVTAAVEHVSTNVRPSRASCCTRILVAEEGYVQPKLGYGDRRKYQVPTGSAKIPDLRILLRLLASLAWFSRRGTNTSHSQG